MNERELPRFRFWGRQLPAKRTPILDMAQQGAIDGSRATLRLYEPIDSWGGDWGVSAAEFKDALASLPDGVDHIDLHINSPGGEVFDGLAILNSLRAHPAKVTAVVEGIAASAASFIAVGMDETVMARNSQMMIHDAFGISVGTAADMTQMAGVLNKLSDNIASIYADAVGAGGIAGWRAAMQAESWYTAEEAVAAGLANKMLSTDGQPENDFDLSIFTYAGRSEAPGPTPPTPKQETSARFSEQAASVLAEVTALADRAAEVVALRAEKGKTISSESADLLAQIQQAIQGLGDIVEPTPTNESVSLELTELVARNRARRHLAA